MSTPEYKRAKYDNFSFQAPKGKRLEYQQAAEDFGMTQAEMFRLAVETFIAERSLQDLPVKPAPIERQPTAEKLSAQERTLLDEFNRLPVDAQKALLKFLKTLNERQESE